MLPIRGVWQEIIANLDQKQDRLPFLLVCHDFYRLKSLFDLRVKDNLPLRRGIMRGDLARVRECLAWSGPRSELIDPSVGYCLLLASECGSLDVFKELVNCERGLPDASCFLAAVHHGWHEIVSCILDNLFMDFISDLGKQSSIELFRQMCHSNHIKVLGILREHGFPFYPSEIWEQFRFACRVSCSQEVAGFLLEYVISERLHKSYPVSSVLKDLLDGVDLDKTIWGNEKLVFLALHGAWDIFSIYRRMLSDRLDPSTDENAILRFACRDGQKQIIESLLMNKRVLDREEFLHMTREQNHGEHHCLMTMVAPVRDILLTKTTQQTWFYFAHLGCVEVFCALMNLFRIDPSAQDNKALRVACEEGHHKIVHALIWHKHMDPRSRGQEAVLAARRNSHFRVVHEINRWCDWLYRQTLCDVGIISEEQFRAEVEGRSGKRKRQ
ncbi:MAG TPA: hypothetical protein VJ044_02440 [Candidatus Hodarchaeales archaeon]|nr:hypothetical protein [Candidatus Hodarchaeales archaeon]